VFLIVTLSTILTLGTIVLAGIIIHQIFVGVRRQNIWTSQNSENNLRGCLFELQLFKKLLQAFATRKLAF
jgi:hypothetical protein